MINNYVPKEDVYYFTRKQPLEKEAKLQPTLAKSIHELVMSVSTIWRRTDIRITLGLQSNPEVMILPSRRQIVHICS